MSEAPAPYRREPQNGYLGGVLAGAATRLRIDATLLRIAAVLVTVATAGLAAAAYVIAWLAVPQADASEAVARSRRASRITANTRVAAGVGFLTLSLLLVMRELGIWWSDALIWPLILAASGVALLWRQSRSISTPEPAPVRSTSEVLRTVESTRTRRRGLTDLYRGGFGVALITGAALIVLSTTGALDGAGDVLITSLVVIAALALILAPFWWRLGRNLSQERTERIRSQERAELAAHLHDSVLQTLTLVQKQADDPRVVSQLARRQERELREWLFAAESKPAEASLSAALDAAAAEVEDGHGVPIEVVSVGDAPMSDKAAAVVAAAKEAMVNAAKFAPDAGEIAVYAELDPARAEVFVRDRGDGFDPAAIPADRQGVRESIVGRMERSGGAARIRSDGGRGTEVELEMKLEEG